jgi:TRAP-type C4-dicarboxylate transport system permease small subunit
MQCSSGYTAAMGLIMTLVKYTLPVLAIVIALRFYIQRREQIQRRAARERHNAAARANDAARLAKRIGSDQDGSKGG